METITIKAKQAAGSDRKITVCFHCGEDFPDRSLFEKEKYFCCSGCLSVYQLLNQSGLCNYYELNPNAGINQRRHIRTGKYDVLKDAKVCNELITFRNNGQVHITLYIPSIHCSSCIFLLENFHAICKGVTRTDVRFLKKEINLVFNESETDIHTIVATLDSIGYEPFINLSQPDKKSRKTTDRSLIYRLGVAGFCFGNIMLFSIPEYFSGDAANEPYLEDVFRYLNVLFSIPVFFYSAAPFFTSAIKGIRQRYLNIDVPVALAIAATFIRSLTDVFVHDEGGFFDAMSGIVFFMLAGRVLQERTQKYLFFDRDYKDYFPMAAMVRKQNGEQKPTLLTDLQVDDHIFIHNNELVPADCMLIKGASLIDYSFVTGESVPVEKKPGDLIYAGGKQTGGLAEMRVVKRTDASHLMKLWSRELDIAHEQKLDTKNSFVHKLARNFTIIVLLIAAISGIYWWQHDPSRVWPAITAILIIACPCGLLLTSTFTNGQVLRILSKNGLYLRNAGIIERMGKIQKVVFDKTGTLTSQKSMAASFVGAPLSDDEKEAIASAIRASLHSFKNPVLSLLGKAGVFEARKFIEYPALGIEAIVKGAHYKIGLSPMFGKGKIRSEDGTRLYIYKDGMEVGYFLLVQGLRPGVEKMLDRLKEKITYYLFSGDEPYQHKYFSRLFGENLFFKLNPVEKLSHISLLQFSGGSVAMIGDGLNDAGALKKSDVGICITDDISRFTPAGDAILNGEKLFLLDKFFNYCRSSKKTIRICFFISIVYNVTGIVFAAQGIMSPLMAAILMPLSTLTIVVTTFISSNVKAKRSTLSV